MLRLKSTCSRRHDLLRMREGTEESRAGGEQRDKGGREYNDGDDRIVERHLVHGFVVGFLGIGWVCRGMELVVKQKFRGYLGGFNVFLGQVIVCCICLVLLHTAKSWRGGYIFFPFLVVCDEELSIQHDDGLQTSGIFQQLLQARDWLFNLGMLNGIVDVAVPYLKMGDGG